jgi:hypothetical protein
MNEEFFETVIDNEGKFNSFTSIDELRNAIEVSD